MDSGRNHMNDNGLSDLFSVVTYPMKKIVALLFSLSIGNTNVGSIIITGMIIVVLITAIMHERNVVSGLGRIATKFRNRNRNKSNN